LNSVWGEYFSMSKWWEKHKQTPPILLANCNNAAVLADMVSDSNTITPAQEWAFETTAHRGNFSITRMTKKGITIFFASGGKKMLAVNLLFLILPIHVLDHTVMVQQLF